MLGLALLLGIQHVFHIAPHLRERREKSLSPLLSFLFLFLSDLCQLIRCERRKFLKQTLQLRHVQCIEESKRCDASALLLRIYQSYMCVRTIVLFIHIEIIRKKEGTIGFSFCCGISKTLCFAKTKMTRIIRSKSTSLVLIQITHLECDIGRKRHI